MSHTTRPGAILLAMAPNLRRVVESEGDQLADLHIWRLGAGRLGAIVSVVTEKDHDPAFYRERLARCPALSRVTVEVERRAA